MALATGEPPARRGYPASVFEALPRLLERPGVTLHGSLTAFYTVLLEDDEGDDPIGEEVKSLLDGHILLSRRLAGVGHFPAIDVLRSESRLFGQLVDAPQRAASRKVRSLLHGLEDLRVMRELGEYRAGENEENDRTVAAEKRLMEFLKQDSSDDVDTTAFMEMLHAIAR